MRIIFILALIAIFGILLAQPNPIEATVSSHYSQQGLEIDRMLIIKPASGVNPDTGAALVKYESVVVLKINNAGKGEKNNVLIKEDLSYIPPNVRITYSNQPMTDGRTASWKVNRIAPGETYQVWFSVPVVLAKENFQTLPAPTINYDRPRAVLAFPQSVEQGQPIRLELDTLSGIPISGALIQVTYPNKDVKLISTGSDGSVQIIAQDAGVYSFEAQEYDAGSGQAVQSIKKIVNITKNDTTVQKAPDKGIDFGGLFGFVPILVVIIVILFVIMFIYKKISSLGEDDNEGVPISATPPKVGEPGEEEEKAESKKFEMDEKAGRKEEKESVDEDEKEENSPVSAIGQEKREVEQLTRDMIARRKMERANEEGDVESEDDEEENEDEEVGEEEGKGKEKEDEDEKESDEVKKGEDKGKSGDEKENAAQSAPQNEDEKFDLDDDDEEDDGDSIDDEAIVKTIAELEQLREQLRSKTEQITGVEKKAEGANEEEAPAEEEKEEKETEEKNEEETPAEEEKASEETEREKGGEEETEETEASEENAEAQEEVPQASPARKKKLAKSPHMAKLVKKKTAQKKPAKIAKKTAKPAPKKAAPAKAKKKRR